jgi:hypothetical protein
MSSLVARFRKPRGVLYTNFGKQRALAKLWS